MEDASGRLCIEAKTTQDLERMLGMTAGHIFHGALNWPFVENDEPARHAWRGGGALRRRTTGSCCAVRAPAAAARVSGIGGHSAAMAVLES